MIFNKNQIMKNTFWFICMFLFTFQACGDKSGEPAGEKNVTRYGTVIKVKPEKLEEYKALHANPWPGVNKMIRECNIRNYSIYYRDGYLFSYFEYTGIDFEADMQKMAADSLTQAWWKLTDPCQEPVETAGEGVWWADMEEVYHLD
jgi:L-rhamnose mutarotase